MKHAMRENQDTVRVAYRNRPDIVCGGRKNGLYRFILTSYFPEGDVETLEPVP